MPSDFKNSKEYKKGIGFSFAIQGIKEVIRSERNFKIHIFITLVVIIFGLIIQLSYVEWALLLLTISQVLGLEMVNSSIERIMDMIHPEYHPIVEKIKDIAAGAVLIAVLMAVIVGGLLFFPKIL